MAAINVIDQNRDKSNQTIVKITEFKGKPVLQVTGPDRGPSDYHLSAGAFKWSKLFDVDPTGDSVLLEIVKFLFESKNHGMDLKKIEDGIDTFFRQLSQYMERNYRR